MHPLSEAARLDPNLIAKKKKKHKKLTTVSLGSSSDDISLTAFKASVYSCVVRSEGGTDELD